MTPDEIKSYLCYYDERNPDGEKDKELIEDHNNKLLKEKYCSCDNCFYGRTKLAKELLNLKEQYEKEK